MKKLITLMLAFVVMLICMMSFGTTDTYAASKKIKKPGKITLSSVGTTDSTAIIKFKIKKKNVKGYQIYRKDPGKGWKKIKTISQKKAKKNLIKAGRSTKLKDGVTSQYVDKGLAAGNKYSYKIRAFNKKKIKGKVTYKYGKFSKVIAKKTLSAKSSWNKAIKSGKKGQLKIVKKSTVDGLPGVYTTKGIKFGLYQDNKQTGPDIIINENGESSYIDVPEGIYTIREKSGNKYFQNKAHFEDNDNKNWQTIKITKKNSYKVIVSDPPVYKSFSMQKNVASKYGAAKPNKFSNIKFNLTYEKKESYSVNVGKSLSILNKTTTDLGDNQFGFSGLTIGKTYRLKEDITTLDQADKDAGLSGIYNRTVPELYIEVTANGVNIKTDKGAILQNKVYTNEWIPEKDIRVKVQKHIELGIKNQPLDGFTFSLYKDSGLKNKVGESATTDENGVCYITGLKEFGTYYLKEDEKPGYIFATENPLPLNITESNSSIYKKTPDDNKVHFQYDTEFNNERIYPTIKVTKKEELKDGSDGTNVKNIQFGLYDSTGELLAKKKTIKENDTLGYTIFENGDLPFGKLLEPGTYTIKELNLDDNHESSWPIVDGYPTQTIELLDGFLGVKEVDTCINKDITVKYTVKINKGSSEPIDPNNTNYSLDGITYTIYKNYDSETQELSDPITNITLEQDSEDNTKASGEASWEWAKGKPVEVVYLQENEPPSTSGYKRDTTVYTVEAKAEETVIANNESLLLNEPLKGSISFDKVIHCTYPKYNGDAPDPTLLVFKMINKQTKEEFKGKITQDESDPWLSHVTFTELPLGDYTIIEEGFEKYEPSIMISTIEKKEVTIKEGDNSSKVNDWENNYSPPPPPLDAYGLKIVKESNPKIESPLYTMNGIEYSVYYDSNCTDLAETVELRGDENSASGYINLVKSDGPDTLKVWVKENTLSDDYLYTTNTNAIEVTLKKNDNVTIDKDDGVVNDPKYANLEFIAEIYSDNPNDTLPGPEKLEFKLYNQDNKTLPPLTAKVENDYTVKFSNIPIGNYVLFETGCENYSEDSGIADKGTMTDETKHGAGMEVTINYGDNGIPTEGNKWRNKWTRKPNPVIFKLYIEKESTEDWDFEDKTYSLDGISYGIYTDSSCSYESRIKNKRNKNIDIVLKGNAITATGFAVFTLYDVPNTKTFYVKEELPPIDSHFEKDTDSYKVVATAINDLDDPGTKVKRSDGSNLKDDPETGGLSFTIKLNCNNPDGEESKPKDLSKLTFTLVRKNVADPSKYTYVQHPDPITGSVTFPKELPLGEYTLTETGLEQYTTDDGYMSNITGTFSVTINKGNNTIYNREYNNQWIIKS